MQTLVLSHQTAIKRGFPVHPRAGERVVDPSTGLTFTWVEEDGLGDLGFWGALVGAISGVSSLFGGGKKGMKEVGQTLKSQQDLIAAQQQEISRITKAQEESAAKTVFRIKQKELPKYLLLVGAVAALFIFWK